MDIVSRLKKFMEHIGMPNTQFADTAKIPRPTISQILNGRNRKISNELIAKLHDGFPTLNIMWLLFGDGDMEVKPNTQTSEAQNRPLTGSLADVSIEDETDTVTAAPSVNVLDYGQSSENDTTGATVIADNTYDDEKRMVNAAIQSTHGMAGGKRVQSIMVFYDDSSFEIFTPSGNRQ